MQSQSVRSALVVLLLAVPASAAIAASPSNIKKSQYSKYLFCMGRALGNDWHEKNDIRLQLNSYGESHPTAASMARAPARVQKEDARCRSENNLVEARAHSGPGLRTNGDNYEPPKNKP